MDHDQIWHDHFLLQVIACTIIIERKFSIINLLAS